MKLEIKQAIVVEGKYDVARLANLTDATILQTDGFAVFRDKKLQALLKRLAAAQGLIILTDSDDAGFRIRHFVANLAGAGRVLHAYVPSIKGKEPRKAAPGKEGLLGVEGVPDELVLQALRTALAGAPGQLPADDGKNAGEILYSDLYDWGLTGGQNSGALRRGFLQRLGLPPRLSKRELLQVLNTLYTKESLAAQLAAWQGKDDERF